MPGPTRPPPHSPPDELPGAPRGMFDGEGAEDEIQKALAWYTAIFEGSRDAIFISDEESRFIAVNQAACTLAGYSRDELLAMRIPDLHEDQDLKAYRTFHDRIMSGEAIATEAKLLRKDGSKVDTEFSNRGIVVQGKAYMHTTARDVTERKRAEVILEDSERRYRTFIDATSDMVFLKDESFRYIISNRTNSQFFGLPETAVLGRTDFDLMPEAAAERCRKGDREVLERGQAITGEEHVGSQTYQTVKFPVQLAGGHMGVGGYIRDITERRQAEAERRMLEEKLARSRTQAAVGQLVQGLAHEVRNPLFAIQVNAAVVAKSAPKLGNLAVHMDLMEGQMNRLNRLMKDMMELGQPLADKEFITSALRDLLLAAMAGVDEEAPGSRQRVVFDVPPGLEVVGVPGKLILAFTHLLRNGLQQSPATGTVRVEAEKSDGSCHVRFMDRGPGIPPGHGTAIFEPFFTTRTGHRGLGLALVRHYVSAHGGTVTGQNNDPPPGACFTVRLPWGESEK